MVEGRLEPGLNLDRVCLGKGDFHLLLLFLMLMLTLMRLVHQAR